MLVYGGKLKWVLIDIGSLLRVDMRLWVCRVGDVRMLTL